ncbi:unnamed protein product [Caenorhabditis bovis]|uniref:Intraflagellar transport protein 46 homolog n=1 Tax=Caenorhabditis bovis TaxID=2654633 RepID=A0A8S1EHA4_9PELO|nr:unnamed protein product [Caenorhabditis bovis]
MNGDVQHTSPPRLGIPISDDSSDDEASQIRALDEEQGIYHHEEVVAPPKYESDEDISIRSHEDQSASNTALGMERRQSVRFAVPYDEKDDGENKHFRSPSPDSLMYIQALENPMASRDDDEKSVEDYEELVAKTASGHPDTDPPAYSTTAELPPQPHPKPLPTPEKKRGLNEILLSKVTQPFANMMRRTSKPEESSTEDEEDESRISDSSDEEFSEEEIQVLTYIDAYKPADIEIKTQLRPFIIDYIPAIGEVDTFIKIPRPDDVDDNAGLIQLDEPATQQSDPVIIAMQLKYASKEYTAPEDMPVKTLSRADRNPNQITSWIANIKELHKTRPAQTVHYKQIMPDIDTLMQEWPPQMVELLEKVKLPSADLDVPLDGYVDIILNLFDIPTGKNRIQSLHLLFSLLNEFNSSQHFRNLAQNNMRNGETGENMDRLEL